MKVLELFAGIGACSTALKRIGLDIEIVDAVEIDKYAMSSFNAIHNTNFEPQDITKWNKQFEDVDLITHGSPCQDFSVAGKQAGGDIGSGTRSSLMYETIRIVGQIRPKYVLWENVKNLLSKKHKHNFDAYIETMNILGYNSYYQVLNAKDYGIPQNRERVYTISIRKDIDNKQFKFPEKEELKLRLKDMLENEVDEKYYLSDKAISGLQRQENLKHKPNYIEDKEICNTIDTKVGDGTHYSPYIRNWENYCIEIKNATKKGYDEATEGDSINLAYPDSNTRRGRVGHQVAQTLQCNDSIGVVTTTIVPKLINKDIRLKNLVNKTNFEEGKVLNMDLYNQTTNENISQCLTEPHHNSQRLFDGLRIRKLTPKECWRLMGFSDEDFDKAQSIPMSNTQLYKQAGNSIVVNVLEKIFKNLF